jgi:carbamoyl-phosphate synthase large subunit
LVSISDASAQEAIAILRRYQALGHAVVATPGTHALLQAAGVPSTVVHKAGEGSPNVLELIAGRKVDLVINDANVPREMTEHYRVRRAAVEAGIACLTSIDTARALVEGLESSAGPPRSLQSYQAMNRVAQAAS